MVYADVGAVRPDSKRALGFRAQRVGVLYKHKSSWEPVNMIGSLVGTCHEILCVERKHTLHLIICDISECVFETRYWKSGIVFIIRDKGVPCLYCGSDFHLAIPKGYLCERKSCGECAIRESRQSPCGTAYPHSTFLSSENFVFRDRALQNFRLTISPNGRISTRLIEKFWIMMDGHIGNCASSLDAKHP